MEANRSIAARYGNIGVNGDDFPTMSVSEKFSVSMELLYIVMVITFVGPVQRKTYQERRCTGILIREDMVLTLASCLLLEPNENPNPDNIRVYERPYKKLRALKVFINNNFYSEDKYESKSHDFGLILIERSKQTVFPRLPRQLDEFRDIKKTCMMGGYGVKEEELFRNFGVYDLKNTEVHQLTSGTCKGNKMICLHFTDIMACETDHGTPMICDGILYALYIPRYNRLSVKCLDVYLTVFSPVYNVKNWVEGIIDAPTSNLEWLNNPWWVLLLCIIVFTIMGGIYYGLVEAIKRTFDSFDDTQTQINMSGQEEDKDDEDSWYSGPGSY